MWNIEKIYCSSEVENFSTHFARSKNKSKAGAAAVEMIYVLCFFLAFLTVIEKFSTMAASAHGLSVELQNQVEKKMIDNGRPVCLESIAPAYVEGAAKIKVYGDRPVAKRLFFVTRPTCQGGI